MSTSSKTLFVIASLVATGAWADAQCQVDRNGNTWNLVCAADGSGETDYECDYFVSLTNSQGLTDDVEATGTVGASQSGVIIWSAIQDGGADIVSADLQSGSCVQQ